MKNEQLGTTNTLQYAKPEALLIKETAISYEHLKWTLLVAPNWKRIKVSHRWSYQWKCFDPTGQEKSQGEWKGKLVELISNFKVCVENSAREIPAKKKQLRRDVVLPKFTTRH